jgi:phosphoglycolate phosphatase-like HAD superfamily hydrolase
MHICLLDIDGTLLLTGGAGQTAFAQTLAADFGIPEIETQVAFAGRSDRAIACDLLHSHGIEPSAENWRRFCAGYLSRLESALQSHAGFVLPGVCELLDVLQARGDVAIGLITGNVREGARLKLSHYKLWERFAFGGFGDDYLERCDIATAALAEARIHVHGPHAECTNGLGEVIVIGDTLHDIRCGRSIGARCVAVATGHTSAAELEQGKPDLLLGSLEEVASILSLLKT